MSSAKPVGRPLEQLEDRITPAITLTFPTATVALFTSDAAGDTLQVQATANPANILYNSGGIGLASLTGLTQLIFNGNGGNDVLILSNPPGTIFAPTNGILFNAGGQADDRIDLIGGAPTWTGTYQPTAPQAGLLTFTNTPGTLTQGIVFGGVPTIRNSMTAAVMAITTPGVADTINVLTGPVLPDIGAVQQGPVLIDGGDRDDHGSSTPGGAVESFTVSQNIDAAGWSLAANANINLATTRPHATIAGSGDGTVDFFEFTVSAAGAVGEFDIDGTNGWDSELFLFNDHGDFLTGNDDNGGDPGSPSGVDARFSFTFPAAGTYYVGVARFNSNGTFGGITGAVPLTGQVYTLHVSLDGHALTGGATPTPEVEPNQQTVVVPPGNADGWKYMEQVLEFLHANAFNGAPHGSILAVGVTGSTALAAIQSAAAPHGMTVTIVTGASIDTVNFNDFEILYVPSTSANTGGGITQADLNRLNARTTAVRDFINSGGGVFALTEDSATNPYGWLQIPNAFTIQTFGTGGISDPLRKTPAAIAAGLTISDAELSNGVPYHNVFTGPAGFNNLLPFVLDDGPNNVVGDGDDRVVALGLGAIQNPGLGGGGPSTAITFGTDPVNNPQYPQMYISATPRIDLNGAGGADTYNIQMATPVITAINIVDSGGGLGDVANLTGLPGGSDSFNINSAVSNTVVYTGGASQTVGFLNLEAMTVNGLSETTQFGDTFVLRPISTMSFTFTGGGPTVYPGDTLQLDLTGGLNLLNPVFNPAGNALPDGNLTLTGFPTPAVQWTGIENFPVPRGLGGSFDMGTATSPVPFGFTRVDPSTNYSGATGFGWTGPLPQYGYQAIDVGPTSGVGTGQPIDGAADPLGQLLRDQVFGWNTAADTGYFQVEVAPNRPVQVTVYLGSPLYVRDYQVVEWGVSSSPGVLPTTWTPFTAAGGSTFLPGELGTVGGLLTGAMIGNNAFLVLRFTDALSEPFWAVSGVDVRPAENVPGQGGLISPLVVTRAASTDGTPAAGPFAVNATAPAVAADGYTIDYYTGTGAIPNSVLTVRTTAGTPADALYTAVDNALGTRVLNPDGFAYLQGFQIQADANGVFSFGVRRPTGAGTATVTVSDYTGFRMARFGQDFSLPTTRRVDFGPAPAASLNDYGNDGQVQGGYAPFGAATYTAAAALGWTSTGVVAFQPEGAGVNALQRDGVFGGYAPSEFRADMPQAPGTTFFVTLTIGDAAARRDDMFLEVLSGATWVPATAYSPATNAYDVGLTNLTSPFGVGGNVGMSLSRTFQAVSDATGAVRFRIGNVTGNPHWTLSGMDIRPTQAPLTINPVAGLVANGTTATTFTVTGAPAGTVLSVRSLVGELNTADANTTFDQIQVVVGAGGTATFDLQAPYSATPVTARVEVESVAGEYRGVLSQSYTAGPPPAGVPALRRFDFNSTSDDTMPGLIGVRGNLLRNSSGAPNTNPNYGWVAAVGEFERAASTLPTSMSTDQKALFRDGATLNKTLSTFQVTADGGPTQPWTVRFYIGDSYRAWPWIQVQVEGAAASAQLPTNVNRYWSYVYTGNDANGDGFLNISIFGAGVWVLNGLDVVRGTAAALPSSLIPPSPQTAAFAVTSGTAPAIGEKDLAPIVAEAITRWTAAGADPAVLQSVSFAVADLNADSHLGDHTPGTIRIDDDAGGKGWFVDPTPADDAEFVGGVLLSGADTVDLLTVVMHELGHELGYDDLDPAAHPTDLMSATLATGIRRLPSPLAAMYPGASPQAAKDVALWLEPTVAVSHPVAATTKPAATPALLPVEPVRFAPVLSAAPPLSARGVTRGLPDADPLADLDGVYVG